MARLPYVDPDDPDLDPAVRDMVTSLGGAEAFRALPNIVRAAANHAGALRILMETGGVLYSQGTLTPAQRELAYLTASVANTCHY